MAERSESTAGKAADLFTRLRRALPVVRRRDHDEFVRLYRTWFPVGHFYSPYPDLGEVDRRAKAIFDDDASLVGVDIRESEQLALFELLADLAADLPFPEQPDAGFRYHFANPSYGWGDGLVMHAMLRHIRPARIIEVGCGHSSAMILDTVAGWLDVPGQTVDVRFIEPFADLLYELLRDEDRERVIVDQRPVQDVQVEVFEQLEPGDVLVIDSTHVAKAGSDVNHLFFQVLPRLAAGVWIHIHDIFMPFEYPLEWIREGRAWQEAYLLRAFLMYNSAFEIRWFQDYMWQHHHSLLDEAFPMMANNSGGNIWLQRVRA